MNTDFILEDIVDIPALREMLERLHSLIGIAVALVDTRGNVLVGVGWQRICTDFHRQHPESEKLCNTSDTFHREELERGKPCTSYTCPHGLTDSCCSIIVEGKHLANLFIGQFFLAPLTAAVKERFHEQAARYGFDEQDYIKALEEVPVISSRRHKELLDFFTVFAKQIAHTGFAGLQLQHQNQETQHSEERYRLTFAAIEEGVWDWNLKKDTLFWSDHCYILLGYEAHALAPSPAIWQELCHPEDISKVVHSLDAMVRQEAPFAEEFRLRRRDGDYCWLKGRGRVVETDTKYAALRAVGTLIDISRSKEAERERDQMEAQLRHAQKMESLGTLAGGIAHDFNNILGPVIGYTDMMLRELPGDLPYRDPLKQIWQAGKRAQELVNQILSFSRQSASKRVTLYPQSIIREVVELLRSTLPATISLEQKIEKAVMKKAVEADAAQLHQVLLNLGTNAFHAMEETGGRLTYELQTAVILPEELRARHDGNAKRYIEIIVSDTGQGIPPENIDRIFEPFFTTKATGKGTGLGLSTSYGIIREHGGAIRVASEVDMGTTFHLYLPESEKSTVEALEPEKKPVQGTGRVLFVDNDKQIVKMSEEILKKLGYEVTITRSSPKALHLLHTAPDYYDILITNQTMPAMTGMELAEKAHSLRPSLPVILCTGHRSQVDKKAAGEAGIDRILYKPIDIKVLGEALKAILIK